jgi:FeS assembly SUF system protein
VGIFSFLTRDRDADPQNPDRTGDVTPRVDEASGAAAAADQPDVAAPPSSWNGIDTSALTAPPAETAGDKPNVGPMDPTQTAALQGPIVEVLKTVFDPEIPVDIYELGLIYDIIVDAERRVLVKMTLTSPACPSAQQLPSEVRYKVKAVEGVTDAWVEIVWDPPWDKDRMSEAAKLSLGFF